MGPQLTLLAMAYMDRRSFARMSALTLAATRLPLHAQPAPASQKPIGFAAIGLGVISDIFMRGLLNTPNAKITALVTGHPETKGKRYAAMYGIPESSIYTYETFDRIRDNKDVDAVYVGLPNSMHREYTVRAAQAGKHVLCEKPMANSSAECRDMISSCRKAGVKLMIAYRVHYDPTHLEAQRIIQSGALGQLQAFEGSFGFNASPNQWRLTRKFGGGGALMDVGIYPLNEVRWLTGEEPSAFTAVAATRDHASGRFSEVEQTLDFTLKFPSGIVAALGCTYGEDMPGFLRIHGDKGSLEITNAYSYQGPHLKTIGGDTHADTTTQGPQTLHFTLQADHFVDCVRTGAVPKTPGEEGLHDLLAMEAIYKAAGTPIA
jgi:predicted dehydrogenase